MPAEVDGLKPSPFVWGYEWSATVLLLLPKAYTMTILCFFLIKLTFSNVWGGKNKKFILYLMLVAQEDEINIKSEIKSATFDI